VDDTLKKRIKELGEAINQSISESDAIADAIAKIRSEGQEIFLVLEATIGFTPQDEAKSKSEATVVNGNGSKADPKFRVTPQDMKFLKSMRIKTTD
jgi:uncharacterized coiled-coil DUF342 family protein